MIFTPKESDRKFNIGGYLLPRWERNYIINEGVLKYEKPLNPPHRDIAAWFAKIDTGNKLTSKDADTLKLQNENVGVLYVVPFSKKEDDKFYFLWCAVYPGTGRAGAYRVIQSNSKNNN